jgi:hypothetical protein
VASSKISQSASPCDRAHVGRDEDPAYSTPTLPPRISETPPW